MSPLTTTLCLLSALSTLGSAQTMGGVRSASFTWYNGCLTEKLPACGPNAKTTVGTGFAATNRLNYEAGGNVVNGIGQGCGTCWHLQPQENPFPSNGNRFGTPVVVKINDECADGGYCDQTAASPNTLYQKELHFDLCTVSGAADQFFGNINLFGVLLGLARQVDCAELNNGPFGSGLGSLDGSAPTIGGENGTAEGGGGAGGGAGVELSQPQQQPPAPPAVAPTSDPSSSVPSPPPASAPNPNPPPQESSATGDLAGQGSPTSQDGSDGSGASSGDLSTQRTGGGEQAPAVGEKPLTESKNTGTTTGGQGSGSPVTGASDECVP